jgi:ketosteroid isomerase-like protein
MLSRRMQILAKSPVALGAAVTIVATTSLAAPTSGATNSRQITAARKQLVPVAEPKGEIFVGTGDHSAGSWGSNDMGAKSPEDICKLFRERMSRGDVEAVLRLYDAEIAFVSERGDVKSGQDELRRELAPMAATKPRFEFEVKQVARAGNIALMHTWWTISTNDQPARFVHAIEIARQQPNGEWRWLVGDPFTVGRLSKNRKD